METSPRGAPEKPYSAVLSPCPPSVPPPDFRAQRQLTEGAHSRDQDVPRWGRDPRPCITPMWGNTPHPCLSFPPSTATHRAQCCFGLQERHRRHPQSRTRAWLWGEPAMGGDWHPGGVQHRCSACQDPVLRSQQMAVPASPRCSLHGALGSAFEQRRDANPSGVGGVFLFFPTTKFSPRVCVRFNNEKRNNEID